MSVLILVKLLLSILIVTLLAEVSKRISPHLAGILSGLPLGIGLAVYFIAYEQGLDFMLEGIPWGIAGLASALVCCLVYLLIARWSERFGTILSITLSIMGSMVAFLIVGMLIFQVNINLLNGTAIFVIAFVLNILCMKKIVGLPPRIPKSSSTWVQLLIRGVIVGSLLLLITGSASIVGTKWAAIFSAFPSTLYPLVLVLHYEDGQKLFPYVIYGFSFSIITLAVFYIGFLLTAPLLGLNMGILLTYIVCALFLYIFHRVQQRLKLFTSPVRQK